MTKPMAWMNGRVLPYSEMALPVWDLGVVAGASISEMARTFQHCPFRLTEHLNRLCGSCRNLGFRIPYATAELLDAAEQIVAGNTELLPPQEDLGIVMFVTAGANRTYLGVGELPGPTVGIHTFRLPLELWKNAAVEGLRLFIPERRQFSAHTLPVSHKTRNRLHWWLADQEAHSKISGSRALLLDGDGFLTETSAACFYGVIGGRIVTASDNVLDSMSRRIVEQAAKTCGLSFDSRNVSPDEIPQMSEAFVSSTPVGVLRVRSIGEHEFAPVADSVIPQLTEYWQQLTGVNPLDQIIRYG